MNSFQDKLPNPVQKVGENQMVKTPVSLVDCQLDIYPPEVWKDKNQKWLIPCSKTGVYELGIYIRLISGLVEEIPDRDARRRYIVMNMIFSLAPTPACELVIRRNYLGKVWNNTDFMSLEGNVQRCDFLKVQKNKDGAIMVKETNGDKKYVKFDCIVGNPPYQKSDGAGGRGSSAGAFYPEFVLQAIKLNPIYLSMVIPSRWMSGSGKGIKPFLETMLQNEGLSEIVTTDNAKEWFPTIELTGGVMYFLIDKSKKGHVVKINGVTTDLTDEEYILTDTIGMGIRDKVLGKTSVTFDSVMLLRKPYGLHSNHKDWALDGADAYICHCTGAGGGGNVTRYVDKHLVTNNQNTIDKWKVCIAKAYGAEPESTGNAFVIGPNHVVSESYLVMATFSTENEAKNAEAFFNTTKFAQYMVSLRKNTQNMSAKVFKWLPYLDFTRSYTDADLNTKYGLSSDEVTHIENSVGHFIMFRASKRHTKKAA